MQNTEYLKEYEHFNGECFIKFNIVQNYEDFVTLAVTNQGRISLVDTEKRNAVTVANQLVPTVEYLRENNVITTALALIRENTRKNVQTKQYEKSC